MLYRLVESETNGEETETHTRIVGWERTEATYGGWSQRCVPVTKDEVTVDELLAAMESEMESENRHSESHIPSMIVEHVTRIAGEGAAKEIIWNMIDDRGLLLGL